MTESSCKFALEQEVDILQFQEKDESGNITKQVKGKVVSRKETIGQTNTYFVEYPSPTMNRNVKSWWQEKNLSEV